MSMPCGHWAEISGEHVEQSTMTNRNETEREMAAEHVKLSFSIESPFAETGFGVATEKMWAIPIGGNRYRLDNIPMNVSNVALGDIIEATPAIAHSEFDQRGKLARTYMMATATQIVEKSGNRTILAVIQNSPDTEEWSTPEASEEMVRSAFEKAGIDSEGTGDGFYFVNVPPGHEAEITSTLDRLNAQWV
jgi:hypothetical protein